MFVGRVCYLPKFDFGKYVRWSCLSVCLCVCLFVRKFHKISRTAQSIITKLRCKQALVHDSCKFVGQECRSNNEATRSKSRSNFESVITPSIIELQRRSKAQNVGNWTGYPDNITHFR